MIKNLWQQESSEARKKSLSWKYVFALFVTLVLCILDACLTIFLIGRGAWEANPLMRYTLSVSYEYFLLSKYFLTAFGLLFLFLNGKKKVFGGLLMVEEIAGGIVLFYEGLVIYEIAIYHIIR
jgi:membrane-anchored protein YejM (alkaline phosphatase superfamily)